MPLKEAVARAATPKPSSPAAPTSGVIEGKEGWYIVVDGKRVKGPYERRSTALIDEEMDQEKAAGRASGRVFTEPQGDPYRAVDIEKLMAGSEEGRAQLARDDARGAAASISRSKQPPPATTSVPPPRPISLGDIGAVYEQAGENDKERRRAMVAAALRGR